MEIFSHMGEYSFAGICFGFLYVLSACIKFLYSWSWFAVFMNFAVERSRDSCPEALMTLIFACLGVVLLVLGCIFLCMVWCLFLREVG